MRPPPFDGRWSDAFGDVLTAWADGEGWTGSVIQLALGDYAARIHLRLFRATSPGTGGWTLGAAHFEILIPGTAEHQVLSWTLARRLVVSDLERTGLPVAATGTTGTISAKPAFREIPARLYNETPAHVRAVIEGPEPGRTNAVPIASDGRAAVLVLGGPRRHAGDTRHAFTLSLSQVIPTPLCPHGTDDWVFVEGPVKIEHRAAVDPSGVYRYTARVSGKVTVTPVGRPYTATVSENQQGFAGVRAEAVVARSRRIATREAGSDVLQRDLEVAWGGVKRLRTREQCSRASP